MPPADKPLADLCTQVLRERHHWDEKPELYYVYARHLAPMKVPDALWRHHPSDVLEHLAHSIDNPTHRATLMGTTPRGLLGFALRLESWVRELDVRQAPGFNPHDPATHTWKHAGGRPSQSPQRVEARIIYAAVTTGHRVMCMQRRSTSDEVEVVEQAPQDRDPTVVGRIPDALATLTRILRTSKMGRS